MFRPNDIPPLPRVEPLRETPLPEQTQTRPIALHTELTFLSPVTDNPTHRTVRGESYEVPIRNDEVPRAVASAAIGDSKPEASHTASEPKPDPARASSRPAEPNEQTQELAPMGGGGSDKPPETPKIPRSGDVPDEPERPRENPEAQQPDTQDATTEGTPTQEIATPERRYWAKGEARLALVKAIDLATSNGIGVEELFASTRTTKQFLPLLTNLDLTAAQILEQGRAGGFATENTHEDYVGHVAHRALDKVVRALPGEIRDQIPEPTGHIMTPVESRPKGLGAELAELRRQLAIPQKEVAEALELSKSALGGLESGKVLPQSPQVIAALARYYGADEENVHSYVEAYKNERLARRADNATARQNAQPIPDTTERVETVHLPDQFPTSSTGELPPQNPESREYPSVRVRSPEALGHENNETLRTPERTHNEIEPTLHHQIPYDLQDGGILPEGAPTPQIITEGTRLGTLPISATSRMEIKAGADTIASVSVQRREFTVSRHDFPREPEDAPDTMTVTTLPTDEIMAANAIRAMLTSYASDMHSRTTNAPGIAPGSPEENRLRQYGYPQPRQGPAYVDYPEMDANENLNQQHFLGNPETGIDCLVLADDASKAAAEQGVVGNRERIITEALAQVDCIPTSIRIERVANDAGQAAEPVIIATFELAPFTPPPRIPIGAITQPTEQQIIDLGLEQAQQPQPEHSQQPIVTYREGGIALKSTSYTERWLTDYAANIVMNVSEDTRRGWAPVADGYNGPGEYQNNPREPIVFIQMTDAAGSHQRETATARITNEMHMAPHLQTALNDEHAQALAHAYGFASIRYVPPLAASTPPDDNKAYVAYPWQEGRRVTQEITEAGRHEREDIAKTYDQLNDHLTEYLRARGIEPAGMTAQGNYIVHTTASGERHLRVFGAGGFRPVDTGDTAQD